MRNLPPIAATLAIGLVVIAGYVGAYIGCTVTTTPHIWGKAGKDYVILIEREYSNDYLEMAFEPAAWVEGRLRGIEVRAKTYDDFPEDPIPPEHLRP